MLEMCGTATNGTLGSEERVTCDCVTCDLTAPPLHAPFLPPHLPFIS